MTLAAIIERSRCERESWRYTDVKALMTREIETKVQYPIHRVALPSTAPTTVSSIVPSISKDKTQQHQIVFVNGVWNPSLSSLGGLPKNVISDDAGRYHLTLEGQTCLITAPIELIFLGDDKTASIETTTTLRVTVGDNGRLTLIEHHMAEGSPSARIVESEIYLGTQAKVVHGKIIHGDRNVGHLTATRVHVAKGAYYDNFVLIKGGRLVRNEIDVSLNGALAQCNLSGVMLLRDRQHADTTTRITHTAPHASSNEFYKSVIDGQARGVFQGKIVVAQNAQKTDGKQLSRALLLSDQAEMNAKPELEIYADDVKCSHGSTVGDLDGDAMFYLRARGLSENEARALLLHGFIDEAIDLIPIPEWRDFCRKEVEGWLHEQG